MRYIAPVLILMISFQASALSMMSTKEKVRLELWFEGISSSSKKTIPQKNQGKSLPVELEHALKKM